MWFQFVTIPTMPSYCTPPWAGGTATIMVGAVDPGRHATKGAQHILSKNTHVPKGSLQQVSTSVLENQLSLSAESSINSNRSCNFRT